MNTRWSWARAFRLGILAALVVFASLSGLHLGTALAGPHGRHGGWGHPGHYRYGYAPVRQYHYAYRPIYYYRAPYVHVRRAYPYCASPSFSLGFAIGNVPPAGYYFYDPYCGSEFSSLGGYLAHVDAYSHPAIIHLLSVDVGAPRFAYRYARGYWAPCGY